MELASSSSSSSSPSPTSSSADSSAEDAADRTELEAAEALADLAQLAMREKVFVESAAAAKWGSKGKRVRKRVKNESPPTDSRLKPVDSEVAPIPDLAEEEAAPERQQAQAVARNIAIEPVKAEPDVESPDPSPGCVTRCRSTGGGRSRQNLTEAEKEERRIRRILANRESARQTIRRRQAICEELTRKAADLALENENLKREKNLALKEYQSLETINKHLKEQISRSIKPEAWKVGEELESSHVGNVPVPSANNQFFFYSQHPFQVLCWPSILQSSHSMQSQHGPHNGYHIPSATRTLVPGKLMPSQEQEKPEGDNRPKAPLYLVPCPRFFSSNQRNGFHPQLPLGLKDVQDGITTNNHHSDNSPPKTVADTENFPLRLPSKIKEEESSATECRPLCDLNESVCHYPSAKGNNLISFHPKQPQGSAGQPLNFKQEDVSQSKYTATNGVTPTKPGHVFIGLPEKKDETVEYPSKKLVDAVAAAEARKRRKELTRLKNLHGHQCRMHV